MDANKHIEKKLRWSYSRILRFNFNKSLKQQLTKQQYMATYLPVHKPSKKNRNPHGLLLEK